LADRISWAGHDLAGMIVPYASLTSIALFIAFLIAGLVSRFSGVRIFVFGLAGAMALFTLFTVLRMTLGSVGVFGARGSVGLAAQMAVGLAAGVLFARLTGRNQHRPLMRVP
jgi:cellobiose-specific phosphotransferase system component IIC